MKKGGGSDEEKYKEGRIGHKPAEVKKAGGEEVLGAVITTTPVKSPRLHNAI